MTDHRLTYFTLNFNRLTHTPKKITFGDFELFDAVKFKTDASTINWNRVQHISNIQGKRIFI